MMEPGVRTTRGALALLLGTSACEVDLERMIDQSKYEPYEENRFFEDGRSMRRPPSGTVHREAVTGPAELVSGMEGTSYVGRIPVAVDAATLDRGENRFRIFCRACHGELGDGQSQVAENMKLRKPPSLHERRIVQYPAGRLYGVITHGYGLMPSYAHELGVHDRWAVVAFVQALQLSQGMALAELPQALQTEANQWLR